MENLVSRLQTAIIHKLTCRQCAKPFEERTNYPEAYTLCYSCDISRSGEVTYSSVLTEDREKLRSLEVQLEGATSEVERLRTLLGPCKHHTERDEKCYHCLAAETRSLRTALGNLLAENSRAHRHAAMKVLGIPTTL